ncbi:MAG: hypothetical protein AAB459_02190 [Patescibacteria group bacterium]
MKINQHIEIVSSEISGLSSMGRKSRNATYEVLSQYYTDVGISIVNNINDLELLVLRQPNLVFLGMKYIPLDPNNLYDQNRIWLSDYLDERGISYTGSSQQAHRLELDKSLAKQCVAEAGLVTSPFYVIDQNRKFNSHTTLQFPLFVKPVDRGGGIGVDSESVVYDYFDLNLKTRALALNLQSDSLVEQYLPGREFSVAILKDEFSDEYSVMPIELVALPDEQGVRMLSSEVKEQNEEKVLRVIDKLLYEKLCTLALDVFHAIGARDYGRIDIRLDEHGAPNFLEANLLPSLINGYGSFPKACLINIGLEYEPMITRIVRLGAAHKNKNIESLIEEEAIQITSVSNGLITPELV